MAVVFVDAGEAQTVLRLQTSAGAPTYFVAYGTGGTAFTKTSTTLSTEAADARGAGTATVQTTTSTGDTLRVVGTQTAGGARSITNGGLLDASSTGNLYIGSDALSITLASGDSLQQTFNLQFL